MEHLKEKIKNVPDFPKPGIMFRDITPLLQDHDTLHKVMDYFLIRYSGRKIDKVVSIESRGFILGAMLAYLLHAGFVPVRKPHKLPRETQRVEYALEYGLDALEIHRDAIRPGENILIIDDVLATGGTAKATAQLVEAIGGNVIELGFLISLNYLPGKEKLKGYNIFALVEYNTV